MPLDKLDQVVSIVPCPPQTYEFALTAGGEPTTVGDKSQVP